MKGNVRCLQIWKRDLTILSLQQPSLVPSDAQTSSRRDLIRALYMTPYQISHMVFPSLSLHTWRKSTHSHGQSPYGSGFSVPRAGRNWGMLALLPSSSPHTDQIMLVFSVQPWLHKYQNLPLPSLRPLWESFNVPSCPLTTLLSVI